MRRGHIDSGRWRNDHPRHFRPRSLGVAHFRPPRNYLLQEPLRFPLPNSRLLRGPQPYPRPRNPIPGHRPEINNRNQYRFTNDSLRQQHDSRYSYQPNRQNEPSNTHFYDDVDIPDQYHVNDLGDVDHRQRTSHNRQLYCRPLWDSNQNDDTRNSTEANSYFSKQQTFNDPKIAQADFAGHRPPSSDHYGSNSMTENSDAFNRSVDDTVDFIRKRLQNRNETPIIDDPQEPVTPITLNTTTSRRFSIDNQDQSHKRSPRLKPNMKSNCNKLKNKIVHQMFKMDKDKIHKLMDNPSSSTKFEFAISSLITESQNSLNRHMRSVAEKSLSSSSTEFMHNDNNTIYEDTFMKQMQCILDPQDTVLLEDIKPIVMAELSRVLQLEDYDQRYEMNDNTSSSFMRPDTAVEERSPGMFSNETNNYNATEFTEEYINSINNSFAVQTNTHEPGKHSIEENQKETLIKSPVLYERRQSRQSFERCVHNTHEQRQSIDSTCTENSANVSNESQLPLFDSNLQDISDDDDDPFAELDNQYHVAVDHNFIETDEPIFLQSSNHPQTPERLQTPVKLHNLKSEVPITNLSNYESTNEINHTKTEIGTKKVIPEIKVEIDSQLQMLAQSSKKLVSITTDHDSGIKTNKDIKLDRKVCNNKEISYDNHYEIQRKIEKDRMPETKPVSKHKSENSNSSLKSSIPCKERQRSVERRPSHRKEKRKKSESDPSGQIVNNNIIDVSNSPIRSTEKPDLPKATTVLNLWFSNKKSSNEEFKPANKLKKRKVSSKSSKQKQTRVKKKTNNSSSQCILSPNENENNNTMNSGTPKSESKTKLKPIDMFLQQPKKAINTHQAHRNTASILTIPHNIINVNYKSPKTKKTFRNFGTQVIKRFVNKETQTHVKKLVSKEIQTDYNNHEKFKSKSTDTLERMKEIDLEIQMLLQEKFKLYNSLESKFCPGSVPALGMTVLNVTKEDDNDDTEDAIVADFTNIPVEELEQIALESIEAPIDSPKLNKKNRRQQNVDQQINKSPSPLPKQKKNNRKVKAPNISLIEQIITDDRPLEDIISLDDLEGPPPKLKKKKQKSTPKRKAARIKKPTVVESHSENSFELKECYVRLIREDLTPHFKMPIETVNEKYIDSLKTKEETLAPTYITEEPVPEDACIETLVSDIQFDMLDVSEDIVICESFDISKDVDRLGIINEEIILDNSQSSADEVAIPDTQIENQCKLYDFSSDENLKRETTTVIGNADAVLAIECIDSNFVAACLDGNVYYFSGDGQLISTLRGSNLAVTCLTIVKEKYETIVYTGSLDSRIRYYDLETGLEKGPECNVLSPIQTMDRAWDTVFVGTRTGFVLQFECKNNMLIPVSTVKFSDQSILALRAMKEGPRKVLLVAARSENVTVKDAQTGLLLRTLEGPKMTVYTLLYEDGKVYCGTSGHQIHVFDYASGSHMGTHEGGKGAVCLLATGGLVFAGCYDGCVYIYKEGEGRPFAQLRGPTIMLLSLAIVGSKIIAGYKDRSLYIWKIPLAILNEMIL